MLDLATTVNGGQYREVAGKLRELARQFRFPGGRQELLDLASRYERRAAQIDARSTPPDFTSGSNLTFDTSV